MWINKTITISNVYICDDKLPSGSFCCDFVGIHRDTGTKYAIKRRDQSARFEWERDTLIDEFNILRKVTNGPNIVKFYELYEERNYCYLVTEFMPGGELFDRIIEKKRFTEKEARGCCRCILEALEYIHDRRVAHRDVKPENLLLSNPEHLLPVKLANFQLSKVVERPNGCTTLCGTPEYLAPEMLRRLPAYDVGCDIWSVGVVLFILLGGYHPFHAFKFRENLDWIFHRTRMGRYDFAPELWKDISHGAKDLITSCLTVDPRKRVSARVALNHEWMAVEDNDFVKEAKLISNPGQGDRSDENSKDFTEETELENDRNLNFWGDDADDIEDIWPNDTAMRDYNGNSLTSSLKYSLESVMEEVQKNGNKLRTVPKKWRQNKEVLLAAVKHTKTVLRYASPTLLNDRDTVMAAVSQDGSALQYATKNLQNDREIVLKAVEQSPRGVAMRYASSSIQSDKKVMLAAVDCNQLSLRYASLELQDDKIIAIAAILGTSRDHKDSRGSKRVLLENVESLATTVLVECISERLRADRDVIRAAVGVDGCALEHAAKYLRADKDIVLIAVNQNGYALSYASDDLKDDREIVMTAVTNYGRALEFASKRLRSDMEVIDAAIKQDNAAYEYADESLKENRIVVCAAVARDPEVFKSLPEHLRADKSVALAAVSKDPDLLKYAIGNLSQDRDCWIAAGLWSKEQEARKRDDAATVKIALSTKFSLREDSTSTATVFTKVLNEHPYFQGENVSIYSPNAFNKNTCDPKWTNIDWPCRGTMESCKMEESLKRGKARDECCWRYSYRWHLEEAKRTGGFMIQVVDLEGEPGFYEAVKSEYALGDGQKIECLMADEVGTKIFRIYRPRFLDKKTGAQYLIDFKVKHIDKLVECVQEWYKTNLHFDMRPCEIHLDDESLLD